VWESTSREKYSHMNDRVVQLSARHATLVDSIEKIKNGDVSVA
jgi:hypothetical protein